MKDEIVEVIKSPEAPHLIGKRGVVVLKEGRLIRVKIDGAYTDFRKGDIRRVNE